MQEPEAGIRWYAVMCQPRMEFGADEKLRRQGYMTWLPHERVRKRRKIPGTDRFRIEWVNEPHFPRYLFAAVRKPTESVYQINETDGVATVIYFSGEPLPIPHRVMNELMTRANNDGLIGTVDRTARQRFEPQQEVKFIDESPFRDFVAVVDIDTGPNVRVWIEMLGKKRSIPVPPNIIAAV